ncbi:MAG: histidine--tRNA ligase [Clostridia bacterium]|nr:histidine--tRNA ligase [Clostridia bacterium]
MKLLTKAVKGTVDLLPEEASKFRFVEALISDIANTFGYREIMLPVFEHTELFARSVGETSDVVTKEMYTFNDKSDRSLTLRPEGTAGVMRAFLEHGLFNQILPEKYFYNITCYRYERPQTGRLREFHQFGVECLGAEDVSADAEIISLANSIFDYFDIEDIELRINSIGCSDCRPNYKKALVEYFEKHIDSLCDDCKTRLDKNPLRILDCKNHECEKLVKDAPKITDYLCEKCKTDLSSLERYLQNMEIDYIIDSSIVRGLDYYNGVVFEFVSGEIGAKSTVLGGGRYDSLSCAIGDKQIPALGFAMGMERFLLLLKENKFEIPKEDECDLFIAYIGEEPKAFAIKLANDFRGQGISTQIDLNARALKGQMKLAYKIEAKNLLVIGEDEIKQGKATIKNIQTKEEREVAFHNILSEAMDIL